MLAYQAATGALPRSAWTIPILVVLVLRRDRRTAPEAVHRIRGDDCRLGPRLGIRAGAGADRRNEPASRRPAPAHLHPRHRRRARDRTGRRHPPRRGPPARRPLQPPGRDDHLRPVAGRPSRPFSEATHRADRDPKPGTRRRTCALRAGVRSLRARPNRTRAARHRRTFDQRRRPSSRRRATLRELGSYPDGRRAGRDRRGRPGSPNGDRPPQPRPRPSSLTGVAPDRRAHPPRRRQRAAGALPAFQRALRSSARPRQTSPTASSKRASPTRSSTHPARRSTSRCTNGTTTSRSR